MAKASFPSLALPALLSLATPLSAVELTDLVGDWTLAGIESPTGLRENYFNEVLTDAFYPDPLLTETRSFSIAANGAVSGSEVGQILSISDNRIFYADGSDLTTVYS